MAFSGSINILNDRYGWAYPRDGDRYIDEAVFVHVENANPNFGAAQTGDQVTFDREWDSKNNRYKATNLSVTAPQEDQVDDQEDDQEDNQEDQGDDQTHSEDNDSGLWGTMTPVSAAAEEASQASSQGPEPVQEPEPAHQGALRIQTLNAEIAHRQVTIRLIHDAYDINGDGLLDELEALPIAEQLGFDGNLEAWRLNFTAICEDLGLSPLRGIDPGSLQQLLDGGSSFKGYCSDDGLHSLLTTAALA